MPTVNPTLAQIEALDRATPDDAPIVMLNLLRFRERADYGEGASESVTGEKAYARYSKSVMPLLFEVGGQPLWMGRVRASFIAPEGEAWDEALLVYYPSRRAFMRMVKSRAYQSIMHHRTAALSDSRLFETRAVRLPRAFVRVARALVRVKALVLPKIPR